MGKWCYLCQKPRAQSGLEIVIPAANSLQACPTVRPHRRQPTRLPRPWDSPGKNTGVGCHFLLQCMRVKSESEVAQSCLTLSDPMGCSPPGSSDHGIFRQEHWSGVPFPSLLLPPESAFYPRDGSYSFESGENGPFTAVQALGFLRAALF